MVNEGYISSGYIGDGYLASAAQVIAGPGVYKNNRYVSPRYVADGYLSRNEAEAGGFIGTGLSGSVSVSAFAGGIPWAGQGSATSLGVDTGWSGFLPDPGGILDNDIGTEGPLSYNVLTVPDRGTLTTYAGGAFTWDPGVATPGFYDWTYQLYENGIAGDIGTVTIEYGEVFASSGVEGFAGTLTAGAGFEGQGIRATTTPTGFAGSITLTLDAQGTAASVTTFGLSGNISFGQSLRGTASLSDSEGFRASLVGTFDQQGTAAFVGSQGFSGTLDTGTFFNAGGTGADVDIAGFSGSVTTGGPFVSSGTAATVDASGRSGFVILGLNEGGQAADITVTGLSGFVTTAPVELETSYRMRVEQDGELSLRVEPDGLYKMKTDG